VVLAAGVTRTAEIHGISAAGAAPCELALTPAADAEVLVHGDVVRAPAVPESPTGCPTPAVVTRAAVAVLGLSVTVLDAGLSSPTAADPVTLGADPGGDVREPEPVPAAPQIRTRARAVGAELDGHPVIAETIPGGTTTALSVLRALGEEFGVSSSRPDNPVERKRRVAREALSASGLSQGGCTGDPDRALRRAGDPVLAAVVGVVEGVLADRDETAAPAVTLGGGTQMLAATALLRHAGVTAPLRVATTSYVARDPTADVRDAASTWTLSRPTPDSALIRQFPATPPGREKKGSGWVECSGWPTGPGACRRSASGRGRWPTRSASVRPRIAPRNVHWRKMIRWIRRGRRM
jgi:uncharacterized protein (TIGR00303 family)